MFLTLCSKYGILNPANEKSGAVCHMARSANHRRHLFFLFKLGSTIAYIWRTWADFVMSQDHHAFSMIK